MSIGIRTLMARALASALFVAASSGCGVEVEPAYPEGAYEDYPPDAYITTTDPYYYEGHATYWYGGRWYYRDGHRWAHYDHEPRGLYEHRMSGPARRTHYEPSRGHVAAHPSRGHR